VRGIEVAIDNALLNLGDLSRDFPWYRLEGAQRLFANSRLVDFLAKALSAKSRDRKAYN